MKKARRFLACGLFARNAYLRFLAGFPPRGLGALLPPRAVLLALALLRLLVETLLLPRLPPLASARALRAVRGR